MKYKLKGILHSHILKNSNFHFILAKSDHFTRIKKMCVKISSLNMNGHCEISLVLT